MIPNWPSEAFLLLPAIDLRDGRCVRLRQGDLAQATDYGEPLAAALRWQREGAQALHLVDLDGAAAGRPMQLNVLRSLAAALRIPVQWGGGLRTEQQVAAALEAGAARAVVGTRAVLDLDFAQRLMERFPDRIVVALDAREGRLATHAWQGDSGLSLEQLATALQSRGVRDILYTDIRRDGMMTGPDREGARRLARLGLRVLASGGVSSLKDLKDLAGLASEGVAGAVAGRALYEGALPLATALRVAADASPPARSSSGGGRNGLARRIVPCLDVKDGRVVKGVRFTDLRDAGDPVELARFYDAEGADELVFYDISASAEGRLTMTEVVARTAAEVFVPLTVGGGIADLEGIRGLLRAGADKVSLNTQAVLNPNLITQGADRFGSQCIVLGVDARRVYLDGRWTGRWEVVTHGGRRPAGLDLLDWVTEAVRLGAGEVVLNSIDRDGTREGYDLEATRAVAQAVGVPVVASGGAAGPEDFYLALTEGSADAALAASLFHSGEVSISVVKDYLAGCGVPVRRTARAWRAEGVGE